MLKRERAYAKIPRFGLKNVGNMLGLAENLRKPREIVAFYSDSMLIFSRTAEILYSASG